MTIECSHPVWLQCYNTDFRFLHSEWFLNDSTETFILYFFLFRHQAALLKRVLWGAVIFALYTFFTNNVEMFWTLIYNHDIYLLFIHIFVHTIFPCRYMTIECRHPVWSQFFNTNFRFLHSEWLPNDSSETLILYFFPFQTSGNTAQTSPSRSSVTRMRWSWWRVPYTVGCSLDDVSVANMVIVWDVTLMSWLI